jgi:hypothetical protein
LTSNVENEDRADQRCQLTSRDDKARKRVIKPDDAEVGKFALVRGSK